MSRMIFLASDTPLDTVQNPHFRRLSVNEALEMGITDIPEHMLAPEYDRDEPDVILWSDVNIVIDTEKGIYDDGGYDDDFEIYNMDARHGPNESLKDYRVVIECSLNPGRAEKILEYIKRSWNTRMRSNYGVSGLEIMIRRSPGTRQKSMNLQPRT